MTMSENGKFNLLRLVIDLGSVLALILSGYVYLDSRFDRLEDAMRDRWTGADMMLWASETERVLGNCHNECISNLPNPYEVRKKRQEQLP